MTLTLAACTGTAGDSEESEAPAEEVTLTLAYSGDAYPDSLLAQYQEDNPHVTLVREELDPDAYGEALAQQLTDDSGGAQVWVIDADAIVDAVAQSDEFVNLRDLGADQYQEDYLEWAWDGAATADGSTVIGLGANVGGLALCYRQDLFDEAGLPTNRDAVNVAIGDNWEHFIALGQEYTVATGRSFVDNATHLHAPLLTQAQAQYYSDSAELDMEATKPAFDTAIEVIGAGISANMARDSDEWNAGVTNGDFAALACSATMIDHLEQQASTEDFTGQWDIADLPGPGGNQGGSWYAIPDQFDAGTTDEAYRFIEWITRPAQQLAIAEEYGHVPSQPALYGTPAVQDQSDAFFNDAPTGLIFAASASAVPGAAYHSPQHEAVREAVETILTEVQLGTILMARAWEAAVEAAEAADVAADEAGADAPTATPSP